MASSSKGPSFLTFHGKKYDPTFDWHKEDGLLQDPRNHAPYCHVDTKAHRMEAADVTKRNLEERIRSLELENCQYNHRFFSSQEGNTKAFKLEGIKALRNVKIKWDLLHAAVKFWDLEDHVFRFNTAELCLTIEEFSTILGYDLSKFFFAVSCDPRHKESSFDATGLPTSITDSMIEGNETLLGLDDVSHGGETQNFLGCPLTLQIWLMKRLDMIAKPTAGLEMADQVDQYFVKVHFHKMTTEYSNWLIDKIVDKEAERLAMREQFLRDN
ncbi:hypothetical protein SO802_033816 [Lithocarpus litseifolius]|uniref:Uncharacterized protein n=1 Tax=Lithocarpus litseifolius TaxID=425828 RepID=A0AAW2BEC0_9ROSI